MDFNFTTRNQLNSVEIKIKNVAGLSRSSGAVGPKTNGRFTPTRAVIKARASSDQIVLTSPKESSRD